MNRKAILRVSGLLILVGLVWLLGQFFSSNQKIPTRAIEGANINSFQPKPTKLKIASLNIEAPMIDLDLNPDGTVQVPKKASEVGWYKHSPTPGVMGPAVLIGHLDSVIGKAVFYDLNKIKVGDEIEVEREDGSVVKFTVDSMETYSQDNFPTDKVYGQLDYAGLRLITCSGTYSRVKGRYSDNLVVYASLDKIAQK